MPRTRAISRPPGRKETSRPHRTGGPAGLRQRRVSARRATAGDHVVDLRDSAVAAATAKPARTSARSRRHHSESAMPPAINGALAGLTVAAITLLAVIAVTVLGWVAAADHSSLGSMFDIAAYGWLSIHLVPLATAGGWLWLPPVTLTAAVVWLSFRVGTSAARRGGLPDSATRWRVIGAGITVYAVFATILATWSATAAASVPLALAPFAAAAVFGLGFGAAILSSCGGGRQVSARIPAYLRAEAKAALVGLAVLGGFALAALLGALALAHGQVTGMGLELRPGVSGTVVLLLASLVYLPTAVVWAASFLLGPGFTIGLEGFAAPWGVVPQDLPYLPLLAAVPTTWHWWFYFGLAAPLVAGVVAAVRAPDPVCVGRSGRLASVGRVAGLAATIAGVAALLANGDLGGKLAGLGPSPLLIAGAVGGWFLLGAGLVALVRKVLSSSAGARAWLASLPRRRRHDEVAALVPEAPVDIAQSVDIAPVPEVQPAVEAESEHEAASAVPDVMAPEDRRAAIAALLTSGAIVKFAPTALVAADPSSWFDLDLPPYLDDATVVLLTTDTQDLAAADC